MLAILNKKREVVFADRFHRLDWAMQVQRIHAAAERYNGAELYVDTTGVGEPVYEALQAAGCRVKPYPFTARSKAALVDGLAILIERREITLPKPELWPEGIDELEAFEYAISDAGNVRTSAPSGSHDDCVVALGLAALHLPHRAPTKVGSIVIW